jgi:2-iminoacetate synthase
VLLLTGEAPKIASMEYFRQVLEKLRPIFPSISVEIYPMSTEGYQELISNGVDGLTVFQETYHEEVYSQVHLGGKKRDFRWRLEAPDRGGSAGFRRMGIGALLGLSDWRVEAFFVALHAQYLMRNYWRSQIAISFPRLRPASGSFEPLHTISDAHLVQILTALRLFLPDAGFTLSTREPPALRDHLIPIGITQMSAGSKTDPGGYTMAGEAEAQFEVSDSRSPREVAEVLRQKGYEPVWKDWDHVFRT